jgi:hypothetical protein
MLLAFQTPTMEKRSIRSSQVDFPRAKISFRDGLRIDVNVFLSLHEGLGVLGRNTLMRRIVMARSREPIRQRILKAAYELLWRCGFAQLGVDEISKGAGGTKRIMRDFSGLDGTSALIQASIIDFYRPRMLMDLVMASADR